MWVENFFKISECPEIMHSTYERKYKPEKDILKSNKQNKEII